MENMRIPRHVAIILDGNGRWAKKRNLPRLAGHKQGARAIEEVLENAKAMGIQYVTVYAFSTENWSRPKEEVDGLMEQLENYLEKAIKNNNRLGGRMQVIGDRSRLSDRINTLIDDVEKKTGHINEFVFTIAINYGGRDEIVRATRKLFEHCKANNIEATDITPDMFEQFLDTKGLPDPDLLIRTSGENRLSNFLPWQLAYAEFYFPKVLWPDFSKKDLIEAVEEYNRRDRRYGKVKEED